MAAPYRHFADKDALLAELAAEGHGLLERAVREAAARVTGGTERVVEAGMAYLRFAARHADYFAVMFQGGLELARYPEVERAGKQAFGAIRELVGAMGRDPEVAAQRAVTAWALVHGLAVLEADGALREVVGAGRDAERLRPLVAAFAEQMATG